MIKAPIIEPNISYQRYMQVLTTLKLNRDRLFDIENRGKDVKPLLKLNMFDCALMNINDIRDFE